MKTIRIFTLTLSLMGIVEANCIAQSTNPQVVTEDYLNRWRQKVYDNHPSIAAFRARLRAAEESVRAVRFWEDPMVGAAGMAAEKMMREDDGDVMFMLEQPLPRRKMYRAQKQQTHAEKGMAEAELRSVAHEVEGMVGETLIKLALMDEEIGLQQKQITWLEAMAANAREMLKSPMSNAGEALRLDSEAIREKQRLHSAHRNRSSMARRLNILLGEPDRNDWPVLALPSRIVTSAAMNTDLSLLKESNPELQMRINASKAADAEVEMARRESAPMFLLTAETVGYSGGEYRNTTVGIQMTLPWLNRKVYRAGIERARQRHIAAEHEVEVMERELVSQAIEAATEAENASQQAQAYNEEVLPRIKSALDVTQSSWIIRKATVMEVLGARESFIEVSMEERRLVADHLLALEKLRILIPFPTER